MTRHYSKTEKRYCWTYPTGGIKVKCCECGAIIKKGKGICLIWADDEDGLEWTYGSECIKKFKLVNKR